MEFRVFLVCLIILSCVLIELLTNNVPFPQMAAVEAAVAIRDGIVPDIPAHCPAYLAAFMQKCWSQNPANRPTSDEAYQYLLLKG